MIERGFTRKVAEGLEGVFAGSAFVTHDTVDVSRVERNKWQIRVMLSGFVSSGTELPEGQSYGGEWGLEVVLRAGVGEKDPDEVLDVGVASIINYVKGLGWHVSGITNDSDADWHAMTISFGRFDDV